MNKPLAYGVVLGSCVKRMWDKRPRGRQWRRTWAWQLALRSGFMHWRWLKGWVSSRDNYGPKHTTHPQHRAYLAMCYLEGEEPEIVTLPSRGYSSY